MRDKTALRVRRRSLLSIATDCDLMLLPVSLAADLTNRKTLASKLGEVSDSGLAVH
jgi:hypothetical protein